MKHRLIFTIIVAIILSSISVFAQEKPVVPDSTVVKTELIKKYETERQSIQGLMNKRLNELATADALYNQLVGMKSNYDKLLSELKPTKKQEVKK
ncbi:MAG: hypothetical protein A2440_09860 [Stygiobacter sp. RIFOXYC2_FULL_38_25]|nr:MAG: hypothetical protein A2299_00355 [Stygiobacter sp. RIFOXYB2_FULL_37_11]OGV13504.1 MAG: hypothetical protein A2237_17180 [Stygiobacter sp. RIFOXYA2_FULL_38_8]OGV14796.1 MAG: hypothetical protein A2440_09860 [Stygiobacter sp. RIFOXYC2_FULL_38_25]OGV79289.1 MAG: hypothetical protein A2X65_02230 [Stygiobacter sp. GWF2_38_21]